MALLEVRGVSKSFGAIRALTDVSFAVEPGEVVGLMGDNGAGKSTMVKLIAGNFPPNEGEVLVDGQLCHFHRPIEARAQGIEVVYQDLGARRQSDRRAERLPRARDQEGLLAVPHPRQEGDDRALGGAVRRAQGRRRARAIWSGRCRAGSARRWRSRARACPTPSWC